MGARIVVDLDQLTGPLIGILAISSTILAFLANYLVKVRERILNLADRYARERTTIEAGISSMLSSLTEVGDINIVLSRCVIQFAAMKRVLERLEELSNRMLKYIFFDFIMIAVIIAYIFISMGKLLASWNTLYVTAISAIIALIIVVWYLVKKYVVLERLERTRRRLEHVFNLIKDSVDRGVCSDELADYDVLGFMKFYLDLE